MATPTNPLFALYEKLYFHEIEVREKLGSRLQAPMAIIVSLIGALVFLIQNADKQGASSVALTFLFLLGVGAIALVLAISFFVRSWFGNTYAFLPSAEATEQYRNLLDGTYAPYQDGSALAQRYLDDYLCAQYIRCSTQNTRCNDNRSLNLHRTNGTLIIAAALIATSYLTFVVGDLDSTKIKKPTEIIVVNPVNVQGVVMTDKKPEPTKDLAPPPPPPPPPSRVIREGVEIEKPKPDKKDGK